jgi:hypothetical protein
MGMREARREGRQGASSVERGRFEGEQTWAEGWRAQRRARLWQHAAPHIAARQHRTFCPGAFHKCCQLRGFPGFKDT